MNVGVETFNTLSHPTNTYPSITVSTVGANTGVLFSILLYLKSSPLTTTTPPNGLFSLKLIFTLSPDHTALSITALPSIELKLL